MILLSYRHNIKEKEHQFGIEFLNFHEKPYFDAWTQWVFFGIGKIIKTKKIHLYPFTLQDYQTGQKFIIKKWQGDCRSAVLYGETIGKIILKKLKGLKK